MGQHRPAFKLVAWKITDLVRSPLNARTGIEDDDATKELAASIKEHGMLQEPAVCSDGRIIYGTRRVYAAQLAGWKQVPCKTYPAGLTPIAEHTIRIEENLRRKDLNPLERARELQSLVDLQPGKAKQRQAAGLLSMTEQAISRELEVLKLPPTWQQLVADREADPTHTRCVLQAARLHEGLPDELAGRFAALRANRNLSVREWEEETDRIIEEKCKPVCSETSKAILPHFAPHRGELDVREWKGRPVAFNLRLWHELHQSQVIQNLAAKLEKADEEADQTRKPPALSARQRIALNWFNHRILAFLHRHPGSAIKWLPLLDISHPVCLEAIAAARALKEWDSDPIKSIPIVKRVGVSGAHTFLCNYLKEVAAICLKARKHIAKNFHLARHLAAAIGIDYAEDFPKTLNEDDCKDIVNVYGALPATGRFPRGMDPRSMAISTPE